MTPDPVRAIADAVLYEGYILWPYRRSALKNQRRFTFGGVYPPAHTELHPDDPSQMRTDVLVMAPTQTAVTVTVRFLHVVQRAVVRRQGEGWSEVDELTVEGERYVAWDEAVEREIPAPSVSLRELRAGVSVPITIPAGNRREVLREASGAEVGALIRSWRGLRGTLRLSAAPGTDGTWRLSVTLDNETHWVAGSRQQALEATFCSTHTMLRVGEGGFVSLTDPPDELTEAAAACRNLGTWPVLVGEKGDRSTMLSSPIILEDYPRIAPESPGDLFDGGEIDQLLILNILTLTDEEKAEMAASDPRAREILERTEALTPDQLMALHGTVRELGMVR